MTAARVAVPLPVGFLRGWQFLFPLCEGDLGFGHKENQFQERFCPPCDTEHK